jgi:hypothetical protein
MRAVAAPGRWVWGLSGLVTAAALAIPGARLIATAGNPWPGSNPNRTVTQTVTVPQLVTRLDVQTYGTPVQVSAGPVRLVQVTETITWNPQGGWRPGVTQSVSGGRLTLADPVCNGNDECGVAFAVTVPRGVAVTVATEGAPIAVSGAAGANLDSGGAPVRATRTDGALNVTTEGGPLEVDGLTGPLYADTGGGPLLARGVAAATATVITGGGQALVGLTAAPDTVMVSTDGGPGTLAVPGGPYALTADSDGGPQLVGIATNPAASRSITINTGGGPLLIEGATSGTPGLPQVPGPGPS